MLRGWSSTTVVQRRLALIAAVIAVTGDLTLRFPVYAASSADYNIPRDAISGGGKIGATGGGVYTNDSIAAQSSPVGTSSNTAYTIQHGYLVKTSLFPNVVHASNMTETNHARGVAWMDMDSDGDWDLYVARGFGAERQDYVYVNNGDGTFTESASTYIGADSTSSFGAAFADYDGDGDPDGFVQNDGASGMLWRNDSSSFSDQLTNEGIVATSSVMPSWGDYDGDGLVDLALLSDSNSSSGIFLNTGFYAADNATGFTDETSALALTADGAGAWADLNGDGYLDLFVLNVAAADQLYLNDGAGGFTLAVAGLSSARS